METADINDFYYLLEEKYKEYEYWITQRNSFISSGGFDSLSEKEQSIFAEQLYDAVFIHQNEYMEKVNKQKQKYHILGMEQCRIHPVFIVSDKISEKIRNRKMNHIIQNQYWDITTHYYLIHDMYYCPNIINKINEYKQNTDQYVSYQINSKNINIKSGEREITQISIEWNHNIAILEESNTYGNISNYFTIYRIGNFLIKSLSWICPYGKRDSFNETYIIELIYDNFPNNFVKLSRENYYTKRLPFKINWNLMEMDENTMDKLKYILGATDVNIEVE